MASEREQLEAGVAALEAQRAVLGDAVTDASVAGLRARLAALADAPATPAQTLKQVSVLFLDVVGSTTLSQHLDPEEIHAVMDGALARCTAIVAAHQGKVLQYAGDNLLAVFGADQAREDDPERAVRCGLALLAEGRALESEVRRQRGHAGFNVRVGIHTGGVLLGGGVDAEGTIRGIAVNIAARMEQTAPAGALRISHATHVLVRSLFEVEPQEPLPVKGVDEPIRSYLVQRAKPRAFRIAARGIEGVATRMVGRDAELQALQDVFARLFSDRQLAVATIVGDAGVGKSRLLHEFEAWYEDWPEPFHVFRGRATPQTPSQPFGLLRDILAWRFQIADDDPVDAARAKLEQGIVPLFVLDDGADDAEGHAHLLGHLIGIEMRDSRHVRGILDDPRQIRNRAFHAAAQILRRVAAADGSPVVLQLEDLHWADGESLDFLDYLAEVDRDVPLLILGTARPALFERRADALGAGARRRRVDLEPLQPAVSRLLADELLQKLPEAPAELRELIIGRAEGNPFYMEELVRMLIDQGTISPGPERWSLGADRLLEASVPPTLTGVLQARLDSLPASERVALQQASVIGHVFWDQALAALDPKAPAALPALERRRLALPRQEAALDNVREYGFSHKILHEVTYDTVLKRRRRELHARAAAWLAGRSGALAGECLAAAAEHFALAGDTAQACEYFARAAEHAKARFAHEAALAHVTRALALLEGGAAAVQGQAVGAASAPTGQARLRWRLLFVREHTLNLQGRRAEQRLALDALQELADLLDDDALRALAARRRAQFGLRTSDHQAQEVAARQAMVHAERAGAAESRLEAQRLLADALGAQGRIDEGRALARQGLAEARALGLRRVEGVFLNALSYMASLQGDEVTGLELDLQDLPIWRELGDRHGEVVALGNLGADWLWFGELSKAADCLEAALRLNRSAGVRQLEADPLVNLAQLALWQGEPARSLELACAAVERAAAVQSPEFEAAAWCRRGDAELALGHHPAAAEAFERSESLAQAVGHGIRYDAMAGRALVALAEGGTAAALGHVQALLDDGAGEAFPGGADRRRILLACHRVLAQAGDTRAAGVLARAHAELQARAATISDDALRHSFLANVPHHREIVEAWTAWQKGALPASAAKAAPGAGPASAP